MRQAHALRDQADRSRPWLAPRGPKLDREVLLRTIHDLCIDDYGGFFRFFLFEVLSG